MQGAASYCPDGARPRHSNVDALAPVWSKALMTGDGRSSTTGVLAYQPSLDGLRALAVVAVVLTHVAPASFPGGWVGVDLFFVLSGYLITRLLCAEIGRDGRIRYARFYIKRVLRLAPAFVCLLLAATAAALVSSDKPGNLEAVAMAAVYLMNWNAAFGWVPQGYLSHTWSLAAEEQFYLLWPVLLMLVIRRRPIAWIAAALALAIAWRMVLIAGGAGLERIYHGFDTHADPLLIGCALGVTSSGDATRRWAARWAAVPAATILFIVVGVQATSASAQSLATMVAAAASAWLIIAAMEPGWLRSWTSCRPLTFTGRISYGWYLWHPFLIFMLAGHGVPAIVTVPLSYLVAVASFYGIERRVLRLKARLQDGRAPGAGRLEEGHEAGPLTGLAGRARTL